LLNQLAVERKYSLEDLNKFVTLARQEGRREPRVVSDHTARLADLYSHPPLAWFTGPEKYDIFEQIFIAALDCGENDVADYCLGLLAKKFSFHSNRVRRLHGLRFEAHGEVEDALVHYDRLTEADSTDTFAMKRKIAQVKSTGDIKGAVVLLNEYLNVFMADVDAWAELADLYTSLQLYDDAAFCYEELLITSPQNFHYFTHYAELLYTAGKFSEALNYYALSLELEVDNNLRALFGLILATSQLKKSDISTERAAAINTARQKIERIYKTRAKSAHRDAILSALENLQK
jgi:tetratricopeptide (TPR) repeat protein